MIVICVQTLAPTTGSGQFTNDVVNLKHQGAGQKLMIGWHKHQGVSVTPKSADVICEQPLKLQNFRKNVCCFFSISRNYYGETDGTSDFY